MAIIRATAVLNHKTGVPKDASRNVWNFVADDATSTTLSGIGTALTAFYQGIATELSSSLSAATNEHRIELAQVLTGSVSPLLGTTSFSMTIGAGPYSLPNEVAVAMSFRGDIVGVPEESGFTRPRSRRRGRIFLGPLSTGVLTAASPNYEPQVVTATREKILDAYDTAHDSWVGVTGKNIQHAVFSRVNGTAVIVEQVSVDDEFDTIRRRGQKPGARMSRSVLPTGAHGSRSGVDVALAA